MKQQDLHKIVCSVLVLAACKVLESLKNLTMEPTPFLPKKQCLDLTMCGFDGVSISSFLKLSEVQESGLR